MYYGLKDWVTFNNANCGSWRADTIHDGQGARNLLLFRPYIKDRSRGIFLDVTANEITVGRYGDAYPNISDAIFSPEFKMKNTIPPRVAASHFNLAGIGTIIERVW